MSQQVKKAVRPSLQKPFTLKSHLALPGKRSLLPCGIKYLGKRSLDESKEGRCY